MKLIGGLELAESIKRRHAREVRELRNSGVVPKLAIVQIKDDPVINTYVRLKQQYGKDIGAEVEVHKIGQNEARELLNKLSNSAKVHGIIVQLPLVDPAQTEEIVNLVNPDKDVDALGQNSKFEPATPMAILWLLAEHDIELQGKHVLLIGRGKLVGMPLERILRSSGIDVQTIGRDITDLPLHALAADVIITATGSPAILYPDMIKQGAVVVDAGVASESGKKVGDLAPEVYERDDLTITPPKGGAGPLTVCALFENLIKAAAEQTSSVGRQGSAS